MSLLAFAVQNARWLLAGAVLTLASSFGQTFFISIFAGQIRTDFSLSHGQWGSLYAGGTLAAAGLMLLAGPLADRFRIGHIAAATLVLFALGCLMMSHAQTPALLMATILVLRFSGQGMLGHLALVGAGRWFAANRGKAVFFQSLGFATGEAALPFLAVALAAAIGWRNVWILAALACIATIPLILTLLARERNPRGTLENETQRGLGGKHWSRGEAVRNWVFWATMPAVLAQPVMGTSLFFHLVHLTEIKGWALASLTAFIPLMTLCGMASLFVAGSAVDRFGSARIAWLMTLPAVLGYAAFAASDGLAGAALAFVLLGATNGIVGAVNGALWPELYGTRHLGAVRSVVTMAMVLGSAIGPALTGGLIDRGVAFETQLLGFALYDLIAAALLYAATRPLARERR